MAIQYFGTDAEGWIWGGALAVTLFASVTVHEFAHSLVALRLGTPIREIVLLPIGGASIMREPPREPRTELVVAAVGPLASLVLAALFLGAAALAGAPLASPASAPAPQAFLLGAGYLNTLLGAFNLLVPAFPMDGGRMLRALLASRLGIQRATRAAASVGRGFALLMGIGGLLVGNIFLILIAVFVWTGASTEEQAVRTSAALDGVLLGDIMTREPATIPADASVDEALHVMLETKHVLLPVVREGRALALVTSDDVAAVPPDARAGVRVAEIARREVPTRAPDEPAGAILPSVVEAGLIAIVDRSQRLLGVVTPTDVLRTVQLLGAVRARAT